MLIVRITPGLANQIYEYMSGYALAKELQQELVLDIAACTNNSFGYLLDHFKIPSSRKVIYSQVNIEAEILESYDSALRLFDDIVVLVYEEEQKKLHANNDNVLLYSGLEMVNELRKYKNLYMCGCFFSRYQFYDKYWEELKKFFSLRKENDSIKYFRDLIYDKNSIGIHIRRGDMLLMDWSYKVEDEYYRAAVQYSKELYDNAVFFVFSDDIEYAKIILGSDKSINYIHFFGYDDASVNEFICLSLCKHRILSSYWSTFGNLADQLASETNGKVLVRDVDERTKGKSLPERSNKRVILLNKEDIQEYDKKYRANICISQPDESLQYSRFLQLIEEGRSHEALQLAFCIYYENKDNAEFRMRLAELLIRIGAYEESIVELSKMPRKIVKSFFDDLILDRERKKQMLQLHDTLSCKKSKNFIIVLREKAMPANCTYGLIDLAIILSHLGHMVTLIYDPLLSTGWHYLNTSDYLHNDRGINLGCLHFEKKAILESGVVNFYNKFAGDELIVISRDERFFNRDGCNKKMQFITTDGSDLKDEEILSISSNYVFDLLKDKADIILTQDEELAGIDKKYIYWKDKGYSGEFVFIEFPWEYGYGQRLNPRMINMVEALMKKSH